MGKDVHVTSITGFYIFPQGVLSPLEAHNGTIEFLQLESKRFVEYFTLIPFSLCCSDTLTQPTSKGFPLPCFPSAVLRCLPSKQCFLQHLGLSSTSALPPALSDEDLRVGPRFLTPK